jgi:hypothetical protein
MSIVIVVKADTIDYWHVYYNDKKPKELTYYTNNTLIIKSSQIKQGDSIKVFFFRDTPCSDCETNLIVDDINDSRVALSKGKGTGNALSFSLAELLLYKRRTGKDTFQVCYFDKENISQAKKPVMFTIKLE